MDKRFKACPGCGMKGKEGGLAISYTVYHCNDCDLDYCSICSKSFYNNFIAGIIDCPNQVPNTKRHNTVEIGYFLSGTFIH